jgi:hypothetical protein
MRLAWGFSFLFRIRIGPVHGVEPGSSGRAMEDLQSAMAGQGNQSY